MEDVLSIKIVSVDHYNYFPIRKLDTTYSEFRQSAVKQVPVIRIFGITSSPRRKVCANVHGVFPYFYVPCSERNPEKLQQLSKDLAAALDKSINISLGQSSSAAHHVYQISLVKGVPFYGYHKTDHQFFRIQLYNPNLARRAANLLQSGTVLGKQFQPHESHIPYILKFFIDYNLFGMSYIHVPLQNVHIRYADDKSQFRKRSVSQIEVDFEAMHILNHRLAAEMTQDPSKAANPGIESLWEDERLRRNAIESYSGPPLEPQVSQKNDCAPTESDIFFKTILRNQLADQSNELTASITLVDESSNESDWPKKKFDLNKFIDSSVYAAEISQNPSSGKSSQSSEVKSSLDESVASQSIIDLENQFMNFSEDPDSESEELKAFLKLEEYGIADDSVLAPLTQEPSQPSQPHQSTSKKASQHDEIIDSDEETYNELNVTVAEMEMFSQYFQDDQEKFPQLDGIDDEPSTSKPTKSKKLHNPQPGPSHQCISPHISNRIKSEIVSPSILNSHEVQNNLQMLVQQFNKTPKAKVKQFSSFDEDIFEVEDDEDDDRITSFYDQTMMIDDFVSSSEENSEAEPSIKKENLDGCVIMPALEPPDPSDALEFINQLNLPKCNNPKPFYSNSKDAASKKEVGHNILEIPGNRLSDLDNFACSLFEKNQMKARKHEMRQYEPLCIDESVVVQPYSNPPSYQDAVEWLKPNAQENTKLVEEEGLPKVTEEKDLNETLIPHTPPNTGDDPDIVPSSLEKETPDLSEYMEAGLSQSFRLRRKRKKLKSSFSKRFQEIMKEKVASSMNPSQGETLNVGSETFSDETSQSSDATSKSSEQNSSVIVKNANVLDELSFNNSCDITGPLLSNSDGFKMKLESLQSNDEHTDLTILSMELHVQTRQELKPNPEFDPISAIFYSLDGFCSGNERQVIHGIIACVETSNLNYIKLGVETLFVRSELEIFEAFFRKIRAFDPDIFAGYEIETASWGYLMQRGYVLSMNLNNALSRMPSDKAERERAPNVVEDEDHDAGDYYSEQKIPGRILLDVWRLMKHEIALTSYSFENIAYHVLHRRYPKHSFSFLTSQWSQQLRRWIVFDYYHERAITLIEILKQLDLIGRTCELAKLFGIQFYEVLSRGSQFRVESMMIRIAKRRNYVPVSPSVQQRAHMRSPEYIPLILEPESRMYSDPVIVLDFQSLYPSIIIAYNYCFSTSLGRVEFLKKGATHPFEFGAYQLKVTPSDVQSLLDKDLVTVSPCGVVFVKDEVREGVLPRMLREILDTRLMVKQSMKIHKNNSALQRVLHSRQLGLKLIANVTYGYTAANFSGRMPAAEIGDSVVSKGRETLERAIKLVESNPKWGCRVKYGDTDSMFVQVPGRSREEAFKIGEEIADAVTKDNPFPIKLKLEKVYQPCILQTKKRYVGFMYETADQKEPIYEAKGIETVRRDGCPATAKILEKTLRILFATCDVSKVKEYVCRQFTKILAGRCSFQDLLFAKEFRGINGYKEKASVPSLALTRKWKLADPRNEPRRGERVPFLIVNGAPGLPLIRLVRSPLEVLQDENYKINSIYYITKAIIPPLNRCLLLIGANVFDWFAELPRKQQFIPQIAQTFSLAKKGTISQFFSTTTCACCENQCHQKVCADCRKDTQRVVLALSEEIFVLERKAATIEETCASCCRRSHDTDCISLDCPVLYARTKANRDLKQCSYFRDILDEF